MSDKLIDGLVMFSGGYDSFALLHKLIVSNNFRKLIVVFENNERIVNEYEIKNAKKLFDLLNKKYAEKNNVELVWNEETMNIDWTADCYPYNNYNQDVLLLLHFTTILRHGEVNNFYLGWESQVFDNLDISKKLIKWFNKYHGKDSQIFFLDNQFPSEDLSHSKQLVVKYLLKNNLFHLPYTSNFDESVKEFKAREYWYVNNSKENSVAKALISINVFNSEDLSKIFSMKTRKEVQLYYNNKIKGE